MRNRWKECNYDLKPHFFKCSVKINKKLKKENFVMSYQHLKKSSDQNHTHD